jgi:DNA-binding CsgD family transcriptional regulator/tetratricopeptide (TPR) repeat protein/transcriptional regulator with XRE-family HTH domain
MQPPPRLGEEVDPVDAGPDDAPFGLLVRRHRLALGLSQEALAERAGISARSLSEIERGGPHRPRRDTVALLAEALGLDSAERATLEAAVVRVRAPGLMAAARALPGPGVLQVAAGHGKTSTRPAARRAAQTRARAAGSDLAGTESGLPLDSQQRIGRSCLLPVATGFPMVPTMPLMRPFVCPVLIGRERELSQLRASLQTALTGHGGGVLLSGEAGVGKSRLLAEVYSTREVAACAQIQVSCLASDHAEPYALVVQLAQIAGGQPLELPLDTSMAAEGHVRRVTELVRAILGCRAQGQPLLLAAEDLQWCDPPSLAVLLALMQRPDGLVLLCTYRPEPLTQALADFLAQVSRLRLTVEVALHSLTQGEVARLVQTTLGLAGPVPGALLDDVMRATDGNPFLVEEIFRCLLERGDLAPVEGAWRWRGAAVGVPRSLHHAIEGRLLGQPAAVQQVAQVAAILGHVIEARLLASLAELDEPAVWAALHALTRAQLLVARPDGTVTFRHALTRDAILGRLLEPERRALHRRAAEILSAGAGASEMGVTPAVLAFHWSRAGDATRAAPYALQAAARAAALHDHRDAIAHYELACAGSAAPASALLTAIGDSHLALGEREPAISNYEAAAALHTAADAVVQVAELELRIGVTYARERRRQEAVEHLERAVVALPIGHAERWRAGLWLGLQLAAQGKYAAAIATLHQAQLAVAGDDPVAGLRLTYEIGGVRAMRGEWAALDNAGQTVLADAPDDSDDALALRHDAHAALGSLAYYRGYFVRAQGHFVACGQIAEQRGVTVDQAVARWNLAGNVFYYVGRWAEGCRALADLRAMGYGWLADVAHWFGLWLEGRWEEAATAALAAWPRLETCADVELHQGLVKRMADILLALGRPGEALALVQEVLARAQAVGACTYEVQMIPQEVDALARLGDPQAMTRCAAGLVLARDLGARPVEALLLRARAVVQRTTGLWPEAFSDCTAAVELFAELSMPYEQARTLREAGLIRLARGRRGDRERAAELLREAHRLFSDVGAARDAAATTGILSAAGLATPAERSSGPLSARERMVAALVAQGCSNQQIAAQLFITEVTVAHHVGAILNKLGFTSRAQVAAYMARQEPRSSVSV